MRAEENAKHGTSPRRL